MKCYFCTSSSLNNQNHMCEECPTRVWNTSYSSTGRGRLVYMYVDQYTIGLDIEDQCCFILHKETQKYLLTLDYLPDVNPYNVKQYVYRLLNLKAFS